MEIIQTIMTNSYYYAVKPRYFPNHTPVGLVLHSVGCPQPDATTFVKAWNKPSYKTASVHGFIDADSGVVYQTMPWDMIAPHVGGSYNYTHIGIEMCEPPNIKYVSGANFTCSNPAKAREYVERTTKSAVELFAYLCERFNLDPLNKKVVCSHHEAYTMGVGTNHGDPEHLWNGLGMSWTMDKFRKAVCKKMEQNKAGVKAVYNTINECPAWAQPTIQKLIDKTILLGTSAETTELNLNDDICRTLVILDRAGSFDNEIS